MAFPKGEAVIYKQGDQGPTIISPFKTGAPTITLPDGRVITALPGSKVGGADFAHGRYKWVFRGLPMGVEGSLSMGGGTRTINTSTPLRGDSFEALGVSKKREDYGRDAFPGGSTQAGPGSTTGESSRTGYQGGDGSPGSPGSFITGPNGTVAAPGLIDASSLAFEKVDIPFLDQVPYNQLNTIEELKKNGAFNRELYNQLFEEARKKTRVLIQDDLDAQGIFAAGTLEQQKNLAAEENRINRPQLQDANRFNQGTVSETNTFNQAELDKRIDGALPEARSIIDEKLDRGRRLAGGFLPTTVEDRLFEQAAESVASDQGVARGFGATSSFARSARDRYTVGERLNLMDRGDQLTERGLQQGMQLLVDTPIKYNPLLQQPSLTGVSQNLTGNAPAISSSLSSQNAAQQQAIEGMPASQMMATDIDQERYQTNRETQRLTQNQAWKLQAQSFNSQGTWGEQIAKLQVDAANSASAYNSANNYAGLVNQGLGQSNNNAAATNQQIAGGANAGGGGLGGFLTGALSLLSGIGQSLGSASGGGGGGGTGASRGGGSYTQPAVQTAPTVQAPAAPVAPVRSNNDYALI